MGQATKEQEADSNVCYLVQAQAVARFLLGLHFDRRSAFLREVTALLPDYTVLHPKRQYSSTTVRLIHCQNNVQTKEELESTKHQY
jgi:hypothetical protein